MGLKLGAELLRSPNGVWYSATGADGGTLGVLRFEAALLKPAGAVDRLVERVVAARAGMLPGTLPVVDLVEDTGRIWLITAHVPVAETASRTEALLLGSAPVSAPAAGGAGTFGVGTSGAGGPAGSGSGGLLPGASGNGVAHGYPAQAAMEAPWRPSVELGTTGQYALSGSTGLSGSAGSTGPHNGHPPGSAPQWTKKDLKDPLVRRLTRALVGLALVGVVAGAATVVGLKLRDNKPTKPVTITGISVHNAQPVQPGGICNATVDMEAAFTTNGGSGTVQYEWEIPATNNQVQKVPGSQAVKGTSPAVHLDWKLNLHGSGTVTAKFRVVNPGVLAAGTDSSSSGDLKYQCP
jgi:hypothetical protein